MKKITTLVAVSIVVFAGIVFASLNTQPKSLEDSVAMEIGHRCSFCKGTGFSGNFNCFHCKGTGRSASY